MAIYHLRTKPISRKGGKTAIVAAAYRAGDVLTDELLQRTSDYSKKSWQVVHSEIDLPAHAPAEYADRATLWNSVERAETAANARVAREVEIALPVEWTTDQSIEVLREFIRTNFVDDGMCADWSIHDKGDGNPHCHILLTTRAIDQKGNWKSKRTSSYKLDEKGEKIPVIDPETGEQKIGANGRKMWQREYSERSPWDDKQTLKKWRKEWEITANKYLEPEQQISAESYKTLGIDKEPTKHEGWYARELARQGIEVDVIEHNKGVVERNLERLIAAKERAIELAKQAWQELKQAMQRLEEDLKQVFEPEPEPERVLYYVEDPEDPEDKPELDGYIAVKTEPIQQPTIDLEDDYHPKTAKIKPNKPTYQPDPYTYTLEDETSLYGAKNDDLEPDLEKELEMIDRYLPFNDMTEEEVLDHFEEVGVVEVAYCHDRYGDFLKLLDSDGNVKETELAKDKIGHLFQEEDWFFSIDDLRDEIVAQKEQEEKDLGWYR